MKNNCIQTVSARQQMAVQRWFSISKWCVLGVTVSMLMWHIPQWYAWRAACKQACCVSKNATNNGAEQSLATYAQTVSDIRTYMQKKQNYQERMATWCAQLAHVAGCCKALQTCTMTKKDMTCVVPVATVRDVSALTDQLKTMPQVQRVHMQSVQPAHTGLACTLRCNF